MMIRVISLLAFLSAFAFSQSALTSVAGGGSLDGLAAAEAPLGRAFPSAVGADGSVYLIAASQVLAIRPDDILKVVAGTGVPGFSGDGGPAVHTLPLASAAFGLYTADLSGSGTGAIVYQDGTLNSAANPAARGSIVSLYGTGAGTFTPALWDGYLALSSALSMFDNPVNIQIGGRTATVLYAGAAPTLLVGLVQINVPLDPQLPSGANEVAITVLGGAPSKKVSVWVR